MRNGPPSRVDRSADRSNSSDRQRSIGPSPAPIPAVDVRGAIGRACLAGELDLSAAQLLDAHLTRLQGSGIDEIILDLRELTFIDSSGVHVILRAKARAETNEQRLNMIGANPSARRLFELTGTDSLLDDIGAVEVLYRFTRNTRRPSSSQIAAASERSASASAFANDL